MIFPYNMVIVHNTLEDGYDYITTYKWGVDYHFKISTFKVPSGYESEAVQVINQEKDIEPYIFQVLDSFETDINKLELLLKVKIERGINRRYLEINNGMPVIGVDFTLAGRIEYSNDLPDTSFQNIFVIDGKRITLEQFSEMLQVIEGFDFKFSIHDPSDELPE